ncbi:MAG: hypothetical protein KGL39_58575, partial [Patescibacteria group bacterium]|nr:hypothetical protein [Patescibacteria group bacterium]
MSAGASARSGRIFMNGYDLSNYFTSWAVSRKLGTDKTGAFTDTDETYISTLSSATAKNDGLMYGTASTATAINNVMDAVFSATPADNVLTIAPFGTTIGNFAYLMAPLQSGWTPAESV